MMPDATDPTSLADIALRRRADAIASTPFVLTIDEADPYAVHDAVLRADRGPRCAPDRARSREAGVEPGDRVGCYLPNSPSWVVASLAVWCGRAAVAAAGTLLPGAEAARLFDLADVATVVTVTDAPELPDITPCSDSTTEGLLEGRADPGDTGWNTADLTLPAPDDLAVAIFTSGTTGQPKGITHTHGDIVATSRRVAAGYARTSDYRPDPAPPHLAPGVVFNPVRPHGRLQPDRVPDVDRPSDGDRAEVHGRGGARVARALRHGLAAAHADDDPHVRDHRGAARPEGREVRDVGYGAVDDRHTRAVRRRATACRSCRRTA